MFAANLTHVLSWKVLNLTKLKGMNRNPSAFSLQLYHCIYQSLFIYTRYFLQKQKKLQDEVHMVL